MIKSFIQAGLPEDHPELEKMRASITPVDDDHFDVWEENWEAVSLFCQLRTQWVQHLSMTGVMVYTGINYAGLEAVFNIQRIPNKNRTEYFGKIQIMEAEALKVLNKPKD